MLIGADINLSRCQERLSEILECVRQPGTHLYFAGKKEARLTFSVTNYCEKKNLRDKVSFFPYYDTCRDFPVLKKDCCAWLDNDLVARGDPIVLSRLGNPKKALFATMFHPMKNEGNSVVMRQWLGYLRQEGYEIHLLYYSLDLADPRNKIAASLEAHCDRAVTVPVESFLVGRNVSGLNVHVDDWCGPEIINAFQQMVDETSYDICFTNYAFFTAIFDYCHAYTQKILLTHDSFLDRNRRFLKMGFPEPGWMSLDASGEKLACSRSDAIIALQEQEATYFRSIAPEKTKIFCIPPLPPSAAAQYASPNDKKLTVGYLGSSNYVNETNLANFIRAIAVHEGLRANIRLRIGGGVAGDIYDFCPEDAFHGIEHALEPNVVSLRDFFSQCDIIVNPENGGTGIKIKTLDALAHGAALVCTAEASVGTGAGSPFHNIRNIQEISKALLEIIETRVLVDKLRQESRILYDRLEKRYGTKAGMMLRAGRAVITEGVPELEEEGALSVLHNFRILLSCISLKDKTVMVTGPDDCLNMSRLCAANGAKHVYVCAPSPQRRDAKTPENLEVLPCDFTGCSLTSRSVDLMVCSAEQRLCEGWGIIAEKMLVLLKPGGRVFFYGTRPRAASFPDGRYNYPDLPSWQPKELNQYFYLVEERSEERHDSTYFFGRTKDMQGKAVQGNLISVVIPCFNVEAFVAECIDSALAQRGIDIELILVDDKSTDGTPEILRRYAAYYDNVVLCQHEYNLGLGPARNTGVKAAKGKYLFFLDSDDYLASETAIASLVAIAEKGVYPVVVSHCHSVSPFGKEEEFDVKLAEQWSGVPDRALSGEEAFKGAYLLEKGCFIPMRAWGALIEAKFYAHYDFMFPPGAHEDLALVPFIYSQAEQVYYTSAVTVMYRQRVGSLSNSAWSKASCINAAMNWAVILENFHTYSLERYMSTVAVSVLGHNVYKVIVNGLEKSAIDDFFSAMEYIASSVTEKIPQEQFDVIFIMLRALRDISPSAEAYARITGYFHHENLTAFYLPDGKMRALPNMKISTHDSGNDNQARLEEIFRVYRQEAPDSVKEYPAMLTKGDRATYYYYASQSAGEGAVIDAGCFVGGTTSALAAGLKRNETANERKIYVYDLFQMDEDYIRQWLKDIFGDVITGETTSFRCFFDRLTTPFSHMLKVHEGDIRRCGYVEKEPIELLGLDCCKTLAVTDSVIRNFFPHLIPGKSIVIHQDYIHVWHPYIHISMELLSEYFVPLLEVEWGGSYVWKCVKQITPECIAEILGKETDIDDGRFAWYYDAYERNDILLQKKQRQLLFAVNRHCFSLTRAVYAKSIGRMELARRIGRETLLQGVGRIEHASLEQGLCCALSLDEVAQPVAGLPASGKKRSFAAPGEAVAFYKTAIASAEQNGDAHGAHSQTAELALLLEEMQRRQFLLSTIVGFTGKVSNFLRASIKKYPLLYRVAKKTKWLYKTYSG